MNSRQLRCAIQQDTRLRRLVKGVFSADTLRFKTAGAYIVNTDPLRYPGTHWLVIVCGDEGVCEFYDTFGRSPLSFGWNIPFFSDNYVYNSIEIQNINYDTCGYHVLYFLLMKSQDKPMKSIVRDLHQRTNPDAYVYKYVRRYFNCNL